MQSQESNIIYSASAAEWMASLSFFSLSNAEYFDSLTYARSCQ